jgi:hypothetical protein
MASRASNKLFWRSMKDKSLAVQDAKPKKTHSQEKIIPPSALCSRKRSKFTSSRRAFTAFKAYSASSARRFVSRSSLWSKDLSPWRRFASLCASSHSTCRRAASLRRRSSLAQSIESSRCLCSMRAMSARSLSTSHHAVSSASLRFIDHKKRRYGECREAS